MQVGYSASGLVKKSVCDDGGLVDAVYCTLVNRGEPRVDIWLSSNRLERKK